jgi:hypothetical protein
VVLAASLFWGVPRIMEAPSPEIKPAATIMPAKLLFIIVFSRPFNFILPRTARKVLSLLSVSATRPTVNVLRELN